MKFLIIALLFSANAFAETSAVEAIKTALASEFAQTKLHPVSIEVRSNPYDYAVNGQPAQYYVYSEEPGWNLIWDTELSSYTVRLEMLTFNAFKGVVTEKLSCSAHVGRADGFIDYVRVSCPGLGVVTEVMVQRSQGTMLAKML